MNTIYQNNNVKNNNQQIYQKRNEKIEENKIVFRKKVLVSTNKDEIKTILIGQTDRSYVTYDGHIIMKDDVMSVKEL